MSWSPQENIAYGVSVRVPSMDQVEFFNHLTVCKQMTHVKLNIQCYIAILETI